MAGKSEIERAIDKITRRLMDTRLSADERLFLDDLRENLIAGKMEYEEMLMDAELRGIRNPAFPGDLIGWLDDDFDTRIYGAEGDDE